MKKSRWNVASANRELDAIGRDDSRLYKKLVGELVAELQSGSFPIGDKMPAERDLAVRLRRPALTAPPSRPGSCPA